MNAEGSHRPEPPRPPCCERKGGVDNVQLLRENLFNLCRGVSGRGIPDQKGHGGREKEQTRERGEEGGAPLGFQLHSCTCSPLASHLIGRWTSGGFPFHDPEEPPEECVPVRRP